VLATMAKSRRPLLRQSWTVEEDARLLELSRQGKHTLQISTSLRRTAKAISTRKGKLERAAGRIVTAE